MVAFELIESFVPAANVAITCGFIEELFVHQGEQGPVSVTLERDRYERLSFRSRTPGPSEYQLFVWHHLAIDAADVVLLTIRSAKDDAEAPADADVRLGPQYFSVLGTEPVRYSRRVRPGPVNFRRQRVQATLEGETGLAGHASSSTSTAGDRVLGPGVVLQMGGRVAFRASGTAVRGPAKRRAYGVVLIRSRSSGESQAVKPSNLSIERQ
jgi:hypothetical protein